MKLFMLFFILFISSACMGADNIPGIGGLGYTCSDVLGEPKTCTCDGAADCWWMGRSGVCGDVVVLSCDLPPSQKCTCDWKKKGESPRGIKYITKDKLLLIEK